MSVESEDDRTRIQALESVGRITILALAESERNAELVAQSSPQAFAEAMLELPPDSLRHLLGTDLCRQLRDRLGGI